MYKLTNNPSIVIKLPNTFIPEGNSKWRNYENFLADGGSPEPANIIPDPVVSDWLGFNLELLNIPNYKEWEKSVKKNNSDDELYYQRLLISVGNKDATTAQYWYSLITSKPSQEIRDAANILAQTYNIGMVF